MSVECKHICIDLWLMLVGFNGLSTRLGLCVVYCTAGQTTKDSELYKHIIYIFILLRRRVWSRNTIRESSHIFFFCGGDPFCDLVWQLENTHDMFAWVTRRSLPSLERSADLFLQSKMTDLIFSLKSQAEIWKFFLLHVFSVNGLLSVFSL